MSNSCVVSCTSTSNSAAWSRCQPPAPKDCSSLKSSPCEQPAHNSGSKSKNQLFRLRSIVLLSASVATPAGASATRVALSPGGGLALLLYLRFVGFVLILWSITGFPVFTLLPVAL